MRGPGMRSAACSHIGLVRKGNEDAFLDRPDVGLWAVADGMGGLAAGDVASQAVIAALGGISGPLDAAALPGEVRRRIGDANAHLRRLAAARGPGAMMGSTVAGLIAQGGHFACFWAGDSRVYRLRSGELDQLTRDHSLVQDMVDTGQLLPDEAEQHPYASVIQRAVGVDDQVALEWVHAPLQPGDVFLLCSDGLTRMVSNPELERHLRGGLGAGGLDQACRGLVSLVLARGAKDNVTVVLVAA